MAKLLNPRSGDLEDVPDSLVGEFVKGGYQIPGQDDTVNVVSKSGEPGTLPVEEAGAQIKRGGYTVEDPAQSEERAKEKLYGDSSLESFGEGAASGATFGVSDWALRGLGVSPERLSEVAKRSPIAHGIGEGAGFAAGAMLAPEAIGGKLFGAGKAAEEALGATSVLGKIGGKAVGGTVEGSMFGAGRGISELAMTDDPNLTAEKAVGMIGYDAISNALAGGVTSGLLGAAGQGIKKGLNFGIDAVGGSLEAKATRRAIDKMEPGEAKDLLDDLVKSAPEGKLTSIAQRAPQVAQALSDDISDMDRRYVGNQPDQVPRPEVDELIDQHKPTYEAYRQAEAEALNAKHQIPVVNEAIKIPPKIDELGYTPRIKRAAPTVMDGQPKYEIELFDADGRGAGRFLTEPRETITDLNGIKRNVYPINTAFLSRETEQGVGQDVYSRIGKYVAGLAPDHEGNFIPEAEKGTLISRASGRITDYSNNAWKGLARKGWAVQERYSIGIDPHSAVTDVFLADGDLDHGAIEQLIRRGNQDQLDMLTSRLKTSGMRSTAEEIEARVAADKLPRPSAPLPGQHMGPEPGTEKFWRMIVPPTGEERYATKQALADELSKSEQVFRDAIMDAKKKDLFAAEYEKKYQTWKKFADELQPSGQADRSSNVAHQMFLEKVDPKTLESYVKAREELSAVIEQSGRDVLQNQASGINKPLDDRLKYLLAEKLMKHGAPVADRIGVPALVGGIAGTVASHGLGLTGIGGAYLAHKAVKFARGIWSADPFEVVRMFNKIKGLSDVADAIGKSKSVTALLPAAAKAAKLAAQRDFATRSKEAVQLSNDPQATAQSWAEKNQSYHSVAPQTISAMGQLVGTISSYLASKLPHDPLEGQPASLFRRDPWVPSPVQQKKWLAIADVLDKPETVYDRIADGTLEQPQIEALKNVYPNLYADMQSKLLANRDELRMLPFQKRIMLSRFFGVAIDPSMAPEKLRQLAASGNMQSQGQPAASNPKGRAPTKNVPQPGQAWAPPSLGSTGRQ